MGGIRIYREQRDDALLINTHLGGIPCYFEGGPKQTVRGVQWGRYGKPHQLAKKLGKHVMQRLCCLQEEGTIGYSEVGPWVYPTELERTSLFEVSST